MIPLTAVAMLGFVYAFDRLGMPAAMLVFGAVMPVLWGERRWWRVAVFALVLPAVTWLVFARLLGVYFEPGLAGGLAGALAAAL